MRGGGGDTYVYQLLEMGYEKIKGLIVGKTVSIDDEPTTKSSLVE